MPLGETKLALVLTAWLDAGSFDIEIAGRRIAATPSIRSFYDPTNQRVRMQPRPSV